MLNRTFSTDMPKPVASDAIEPLNFKTWVLKVSIHCEGCKKEVKKALQSIEGVYRTEVDSEQQKAIVTGNVDAETLIKKLLKTGKHAEIWPQNPDQEELKPCKIKKIKSMKDPNIIKLENVSGLNKTAMAKASLITELPDTSAINHSKTAAKAHISDEKMKMKELSEGFEGVNLRKYAPQPMVAGPPKVGGPMAALEAVEPMSVRPSNQSAYSFQPAYFSATENRISYNTAYHGGNANTSACYVPPMNSYAYFGQHPHAHQSSPVHAHDGYYDYEDDEESGCSIM